MIKLLRRRHLQIWALWAVLLPAGIVSAVVARKQVVTDSSLQIHNRKMLPFVIKEKSFDGNIVQLRGHSTDGVEQFVWMNKSPLKVASASIYSSPTGTASIQSSKYLGRIETRGDYAFTLPVVKDRLYCFIVYDFIHEKEISRIDFNLNKTD